MTEQEFLSRAGIGGSPYKHDGKAARHWEHDRTREAIRELLNELGMPTAARIVDERLDRWLQFYED